MKVAPRFIFFILLFTFLLIPQKAYAFILPATLSLVAATVGSTFWYIVLALSVNSILFIKKIGKISLVIRIMAMIFFVMVGIYCFITYNVVKYKNVPYDNIPLMKDEIDLNNISVDQLSEYTILYFDKSVPEMKVTDSVPIDLPDLLSAFFNFPQFERIHAKALRKDKKVLVLCYYGYESFLLARCLNEHGYHAFGGRMFRTDCLKFINQYFNSKEMYPMRSFFIVPYKGEQNMAFINFSYNEKRFDGTLKQAEPIDPDRFIKGSIAGKNIACFSDYDCLMTQSFLYSRHIKNQNIYKIEAPPGT